MYSIALIITKYVRIGWLKEVLSKSMKQYVMNQEKNGYSKETQNVYNNRLKNYAIDALKDLALLAEKLPEDELQDVFNEKTLSPLIRNVFRAKLKDNYEEKEFEQRRQRILRLSWDTLTEIGFRDNAWNLAPDVMNILIKAGLHENFDTFVGLKAIYIKGFNQIDASTTKAPPGVE
ncbi:MAG TPA: hypothetical protein VLH35_01055 [Candidatus Acidoferrales bacterium]|nr:hypothetical protein [Candidatus Acidoferrales bacterium]